MIGGKLNLAALHHVKMEPEGENGKVKGIFIPIEKNQLFEGKEGAVYLDLVAFEVKDSKFDDTHLVKQSLPKEVYDKMSKEEKESTPILGNLNVNAGSGSATVNDAGDGKTVSPDKVPF